MEQKLLFSRAPSVALPFCVSYKPSSPSLRPPRRLSLASSFWGSNSTLRGSSLRPRSVSQRPLRRVEPVRAGGPVKRRKERPFDNVIQRDKKLKLVMKIRKILVSQPDRVMSLRDLGRFRRELGLNKKRRFIALLRKFPAVFDIVEEGVFSLKFRLTPQAEELYLDELRIKNQMEDILVVKLRKLLLMSMDKRILLEKIAHLRTDLGLPLEFRDTICQRYPQYFRVVASERGPLLELTSWDPELAVSAAELAEEEMKEREMEERDLIIDRPVKFNRVRLPKGLSVSKGEMRKICQFRDMPFISPYKDFAHLRSGTPEKEKHACAVVHEMLSLMLEKRTLVDHLTHFREEFRFSQQIRGMLIRHPDMFYVSLKGDRDSVFLREAYSNSQLIEKDELLLIKEKLRTLVSVPRYPRSGVPRTEDVDGSGETDEDAIEDDDDDEWSDVDGAMGSGDDWSDEDENDEGVDDWSDEDEEEGGDDDSPPSFDDEDNEIIKSSLDRQIKQVSKASGGDRESKKSLDLVFPDGRPRERW
uniref:PORR domain-containing protein n=1 Tax=Kalanchoe fedtschenkoi TaxID=63787 RepID=A0A7N0TYH1_KALFE